MKLLTQTERLSKVFGFEKSVEMLCDAGYDAIDFTAFNSEEFYTDAHSKEYYENIRKYAENRGVTFNQAHAPFASTVNDEEENKQRFKNIVCSMKNASYLGVKHIVVHPCQHLPYNEGDNEEILFEYNMDFYKKLIPYAEEYNIKIAMENMWQCFPNSSKICHSTCSRPEEFIRYFDTLNNDSIICCLDMGHTALVSEHTGNFIRKLGGKRLSCLHVHDVDGVHDSHTLPYFGMIDWEDVMKALAEIDYKGDLTFEADNFFSGKPEKLYMECTEFMQKTGRILIEKFNNYKK